VKAQEALRESGIRSEIDSRNETLDKRIRNSELNKIPYSLILGEREAKNNTVSVRKRVEGDKGVMALEDFIKKVKEEINNKR
jgi:threonyl-tRNA synthetase